MTSAVPDTGVSAPVTRAVRCWTSVILVVAVAPIGLVAWLVFNNPRLSIFDEYLYVDYLAKIHRGVLLKPGMTVDTMAMEALACRGWGLSEEHRRTAWPPCRQPFLPDAFPHGGNNWMHVHSPLYFVLTDLVARGILQTGVTSDLVTAGRLVGGLWLTIGLLLTHALTRELGASESAGLGILAAMAASPFVLLHQQYLTPDALDIAAGAGVALAALRWERNASSTGWLVAAAVFAPLVKITNLLSVLAVATYLVAHRGIGAHRSGGASTTEARRALIGSIALIGSALAAALAWLMIRDALTLRDVRFDQGAPLGTPSMRSFFAATTALVSLPTRWDRLSATPGAYFQWLFVCAAIGPLVLYRRLDRGFLLSASAVFWLVLGGPVWLFVSYLESGADLSPVPARYGLSLLPIVLGTFASLQPTAASGVIARAVVWLVAAMLWWTTIVDPG